MRYLDEGLVDILLRPEFLIAAGVIVGGSLLALSLAHRGEADRRRPWGNREDRHRIGGSRDESPRPEELPERVTATFADVAGLDQAIVELSEVRDYLRDPERLRALGAELPRGVLLYGPPGTGKTLLARALAGEAGVPFLSVSATAFVEQFVGVGAARIRQLFEEARHRQPSIVFIDELDGVGRARGGGPLGEREYDHTLNQLLVELDGFGGGTGVLILAATNRPELLDPALIRPGRFDRRIQVDRPDLSGRESILRLHAARRPFAATVDWHDVAAHTAGLAGAELAHIVNESALLAARRHRTTISTEDLEEAVARVLRGPRSPRVLSERDKSLIAHHESGHALLSLLLSGVRPPPRISIVARTGALARSPWALDEDREILGRNEVLAQLVVLLGGRAAEVINFGEPSTRSEDDLKEAERLARRMIQQWAMTGRFAGGGTEGDALSRIYSEVASGGPVDRLLGKAERAARTMLEENQGRFERLSRELVKRETLSAGEVARIVGIAEGPPAVQSVPGRRGG